MSIKAIEWALSTEVGNHHAKLVLVNLANNADDEKFQCWPSVGYLAKRCELHRATVYRAIVFLTKKSLIHHERRRWPSGSGKQPLFTLLIPPPVAISDTLSHSSATTLSHCSDNKRTFTEPSQIKKDQNGFQEGKSFFKAMPHSPEWNAWKAYFEDRGHLGRKQFLLTRELEGRAFEFETQWPPH